MADDLTSLFSNQAEAVLAERTLIYLRDQKQRFGIGPVSSPYSDSMLAYLKHDLLQLVEDGAVDHSIFNGQRVNCSYISDKLPTILDYLVSVGRMEKISAGYVLKS